MPHASPQVGVPGVACWCLGVPIGTALFLKRKRGMLEDEFFSARYGFLYEGQGGGARAAAV